MGITWRFAMPLLSTLAALVLIVHSEEDVDRDYRYELRPKYMDTRPAGFEQPWRASDPQMQQYIPIKTWSNDPDDQPSEERKPKRKRKRRPPPDSELAVRPKYQVDDEEFINPHTTDHENTETPRRRRKKMNLKPIRWSDEPVDSEVQIRRRLHRRKRPSLETWPELSEFGGFSKDSRPHLGTDPSASDFVLENEANSYRDPKIAEEVVKGIQSKSEFPIDDIDDDDRIKNDRSLSEFSTEVLGPNIKFENSVQVHDNVGLSYNTAPNLNGLDKTKSNGPVDPQTLKQILKRSNGTSLSEILQQNNLSLADLLSGNDKALSLIKSEKSLSTQEPDTLILEETGHTSHPHINDAKDSNEKSIENISADGKEYTVYNSTNHKNEPQIVIDNKEEIITNENATVLATDKESDNKNITLKETTKQAENVESFARANQTSNLRHNGSKSSVPVMVTRRRFPEGVRRKLRMRPTLNSTYKSQLNRDLIALSAKRYVHHSRRNSTKAREWRSMIPLMPNVNISTTTEAITKHNTVASTPSIETTTTQDNDDDMLLSTVTETTQTELIDEEPTTPVNEIPETSTIEIEVIETEIYVTESPKHTFSSNPKPNDVGMRRRTNRQKKKRLKQKTSTQPPYDDITNMLFHIGNYVSSSELVTRTHVPKRKKTNEIVESVTDLEDFMTTETTSYTNSGLKHTRPYNQKSRIPTRTNSPFVPTEKTAKFEIDEILNDTLSRAKLSKILRERNMTLNELLEHRERGSSHVHLADIFHNASREPNPPEPFLSKSLLEPISRETYPLRALLEANLHDTTTKSTTIDPYEETNYIHIPIKMDFGKNVNENAENMGIMSLFNNFTKDNHEDKTTATLEKDSEGTPYKSTITQVNATDDESELRESRMLNYDQDMVSWNEIFAMIQKHNKNDTKAIEVESEEKPPTVAMKKITIDEDIDGDGLIVLEDLQNLSNKMSSESEENIEFKSFESAEFPENKSNLIHNSTRSVTVATAGIIGLAMVLFLLTYAALKWKQQRSINRKNTFGEERIPTPVFENRKVKKNCSSRSISPMLPTSNIYTISTLDSQNGKESPEYMWDSLRKPFQ